MEQDRLAYDGKSQTHAAAVAVTPLFDSKERVK
jgi:hypothetical protein